MDVIIMCLRVTSNMAVKKKKSRSTPNCMQSSYQPLSRCANKADGNYTGPKIPHWYQYNVWRAQSAPPQTKQKIMIGQVYIIFGSPWKKQHLTCGLKVGGRGSERWRQSPPVSTAKQHHGNGPAPWRDEWQPAWGPSGRRGRVPAATCLTQQTRGADPSAAIVF